MRDAPVQIHATVVSIDGKAIVIRGPSGSGKSDLALRLIGDGAVLVADDRADLSVENDSVSASPPDEIAGMMEVRGLGVFRFDYAEKAPVSLVVDLVEPGRVERLPEPTVCSDWGPAIPCVKLSAFEASTPHKVRIALEHALNQMEAVS